MIKLNESVAARRRIPFHLADSTDPTGQTPKTGQTFSAAEIQVSKAGGSYANFTGTATEIANGDYYYEFATGEIDTIGFVLVRINKSGAFVQTVSDDIYADGIVRRNTAQAGAAQSITLDAGASVTDGLHYGQIVILNGGTGAGQSRRIVGYTGSSKVAVVDSAWVTNPDSTSTFVIVADAQGLNLPTHKTTSTTLTATSFTTDLAESTNNHWNDAYVRFISGALAGQVKKITAYNGSTKAVTVNAFTGAPAAGDLFVVVNG